MEARCELMGRRIELETSMPYPGLDAEIPGAYWSDRKRRWSLPLGMAVCRNIREVFGSRLEIGPRLAAWAWAEREAEKSQAALGKTLTAIPLPRVEAEAPTLFEALKSRPFQMAGARYLAEGRGGLLAYTPGLGKTTTSIAGVVESGVSGPFLVAAPVAAMSDAWERELLARLGDSAIVHTITGSKAVRNKRLESALLDVEVGRKPVWIIINIEMLRTKVWWICPECEARTLREAREKAEAEGTEPMWNPEAYRWEASDKPKANVVECGHNPRKVRTEREHQYPQLFDVAWGAIIMDECQRSLLRPSGKPTQTRQGAMLLDTTPDGLRIALSGTPMRGKPQRLWGVLNWLRREVFSGFWSWCERFWTVTQTGYGGAREIGAFIEERAEAFYADMDRYVLRVTKAEVQADLPPKAYMGTPLDPRKPEGPSNPVAVWLAMDPKQEKAYREMLTVSSAQVDGGRLHAVGILAEMTRLKQFASSYGQIINEADYRPMAPSNKLDWIEQFLLERNILRADADDEATGKVVIVSQFTSLLQMIGGQLYSKHGSLYSRVTGAVTGKERQRQIDRFNDPESGVNIMLLNTTAGGVAVTLDAADDMVFTDETHVPDDQEQAEGRIDNRRPEVKVVQRRYWYLKSLGSIDEAIARTNGRREADQKQHLDGRRGVEYAREVFATMRELVEGRKS